MTVPRSKDMFANFFPIEPSVYPVADSTLVSQNFDTGLSIRGGLVWLIHKIEWQIQWKLAADAETIAGAYCQCGISTKKGLTTQLFLADEGLLDLQELASMAQAVTAAGLQWQFIKDRDSEGFLPPIPLAAPNLTFYAMSSDVSALLFTWASARILYTTMPVDEATYTEIAEVWQW